MLGSPSGPGQTPAPRWEGEQPRGPAWGCSRTCLVRRSMVALASPMFLLSSWSDPLVCLPLPSSHQPDPGDPNFGPFHPLIPSPSPITTWAPAPAPPEEQPQHGSSPRRWLLPALGPLQPPWAAAWEPSPGPSAVWGQKGLPRREPAPPGETEQQMAQEPRSVRGKTGLRAPWSRSPLARECWPRADTAAPCTHGPAVPLPRKGSFVDGRA